MKSVTEIVESLQVSPLGGDLEGAGGVFFLGIGGIGMSATSMQKELK